MIETEKNGQYVEKIEVTGDCDFFKKIQNENSEDIFKRKGGAKN